MRGNSLNVYRANFIVITFMLAFLCVLPIMAQPTSLRSFPLTARMKMTWDRLKELEQINSQIENNKSNVSLYKKRLQIYGELLELTSDNNRNTYADKYEADLSYITELEKTSEAYFKRGNWFLSRFIYNASDSAYSLPSKISELYPHNSYFDKATADFLKAIQLTSDPHNLQAIYTNLSIIYRARPQLLVSAPDFPKWKDEIPLKLVRQDLEMSIKYQELAIKAGANLPYIKELKHSLVATYLSNAEVAEKLGDSATALKYTQAAQKYRE
ncbi:MAG: hypothetical protein ACR2GD_13750 [Pyrinomonadaceae bacterium]